MTIIVEIPDQIDNQELAMWLRNRMRLDYNDENEFDYDDEDDDGFDFDDDDDYGFNNYGSRSSSKPKGEDLISSLPDAVLCHILSFLPTKHAVQTSILAKRWRFLWASVPVLDFDDKLLFNYSKGGLHGIGGVNFINFIDRVMVRTSESSIIKFRLHCSRRHSFHLNAWINLALKHKVQELDLCIERVVNYSLSFPRFASENLVVLKLGKNILLDISGSFDFPSLKVFHLDSIEFTSCSSTEKLFSCCPALEELIIQECKLDGIRNLHVAGPELKSLAIDCFSYERYEDYSDDEDDEYSDYWATNGNEGLDYRIVVDAPKLVNLKYKDYVATKYSFNNHHSLIRAKIDLALSNPDRFAGRCKRPDVSKSGIQLLRGISDTKFLHLSGTSLKVLSLIKHKFPMFYNLIELKLRCDEYCGLLLGRLLKSTPNLEVLVLGKENARSNQNQRDLEKFVWKPPECVPECLSKHLKTVRIWGFNGQENVAKFTAYLQENGNVSVES